MTRVELYLAILEEFPLDDFASDVGEEIADCLFNIVVSTRDPELAWNLMRSETCRSDWETSEWDINFTISQLNKRIDFIKGINKPNKPDKHSSNFY